MDEKEAEALNEWEIHVMPIEVLKVEINTFVWMHAPPDTTLRDAEEMACQILNILRPN